MKAIKRPLTYFLIWAWWMLICIGIYESMDYTGAFLLCMITSLIIYVIAYYHIVFSSDKIIKEKEPELYSRLENEFGGFRLSPEMNAAAAVLITGRARKYPSLRPQIFELIASMVLTLSAFVIFAAVTLYFMFIS